MDEKVLEKASQPDYFGSKKEKTEKKKNEEAFFKQGEKPEVRKVLRYIIVRDGEVSAWLTHSQKKQIASARADDQKAVDKALITNIKKEPFLLSYLHATFSLRNGDRPHEMVF